MAVSAHSMRRSLAVVLFFVTALSSYTFITVHGHGHGHGSEESGSGGCPFSTSSASSDHHHSDHDHHHHHHHHVGQSDARQRRKLPEELAEEEDLKLERAHGTDHHHHHDDGHSPTLGFSSPLGLWLSAMGCSLLVSLASLICLILLPMFFLKGKPSKGLVDCLATFGAGAMLGDAFLHQLPHAYGGEHSDSHDHSAHDHEHGGVGGSHAHSLKDLSIGLSVLFGIVLFLLVEKLVRYVESVCGSGDVGWGHHHHHHGHGKVGKLKADDDATKSNSVSADANASKSDGKPPDDVNDDDDSLKDKSQVEGKARRRKRAQGDEADANPKASDVSVSDEPSHSGVVPSTSHHPSSLVFGYLNLFSDGVHNFTDGMALGSAFLLYGSVGGWSRTLFLLAHELPQEIGDFGILVRSGFTVPKALFFNFLSALVALAGTALALLMGKQPGNSSFIEGFTAGGFIYIAVAGVLPELNSGSTTIRSTFAQLTSLLLGMGVALYISHVE